MTPALWFAVALVWMCVSVRLMLWIDAKYPTKDDDQ